jgi:hypothetical protein
VSEPEELNQKEEKRLLDLLAQGLSQDFPNPERIGCPDPAVLRAIALHKLPLTEARQWLDHLSTCSPCFQQASQFRKEAEGRRRRRWTTAGGAAILLLAIAVWVWVHTRKPTTEVLDLRQVPAVNPQNPVAQGQHTLVLYRWARHLTLDLPAGSEPGIEEEIAVFTETNVEVFDTSATTQLRDQVVIVEVDVDLGNFQPGEYFLGIRQPGLTWTDYRVSVP